MISAVFNSSFFKKDDFISLKFGLFTGVAVIAFQVFKHFVIYNYFTIDYYLVFVAVCFLLVGLRINKDKTVIKEAKNPGEKRYTLFQNTLTAKEIQILKLIAEGKSNKEIAGIHYIEISTVKTHINNLYTKLSLKNRKEAYLKYAEMLQNGLKG
jgi:DNA-binding CsgD family transcriptional regulator